MFNNRSSMNGRSLLIWDACRNGFGVASRYQNCFGSYDSKQGTSVIVKLFMVKKAPNALSLDVTPFEKPVDHIYDLTGKAIPRSSRLMVFARCETRAHSELVLFGQARL